MCRYVVDSEEDLIIEFGAEVSKPVENKICGDNMRLNNSTIMFKGKGNILFSDGDVELTNSKIVFCGDNACVYLSESHQEYKLNLDMWRDTTAFFGGGSYFNSTFNAIISERKNLIVGSGGVFSFGIWVRTADPHIIYSVDTHKRINPSKSVYIGDHVWIGQNATILKGSRIGSGSILSANCVIAGKAVGSNTIYAGNPGRRIKDGIFFLGNSVHNFTKNKAKEFETHSGNEFIYKKEGEIIAMKEIENNLSKGKGAEDRVDFLRRELAGNTSKNRFYVEDKKKKKGLFSVLLKK